MKPFIVTIHISAGCAPQGAARSRAIAVSAYFSSCHFRGLCLRHTSLPCHRRFCPLCVLSLGAFKIPFLPQRYSSSGSMCSETGTGPCARVFVIAVAYYDSCRHQREMHMIAAAKPNQEAILRQSMHILAIIYAISPCHDHPGPPASL